MGMGIGASLRRWIAVEWGGSFGVGYLFILIVLLYVPV